MEVRQAQSEFLRYLQSDRRKRVQEAGTFIESIMKAGKFQED